jgi:hypothetical protein
MVYELLNPEAPRGEWRRQPLANAYVTIDWSVTIPMPAHATSSCRYAEIARTDQNGRYTMEGPNFITAGAARARALVYAPGRDRVPYPYPGSEMKEQDITMVKSTRTPEERLGVLHVLSMSGCMSERATNDPRGLMKPYLETLLAEARTLKIDTQYGRNTLNMLEATLKYSDPANLAPQPIRPVPVEADQRGLQQRDTVPGTR